MKKFQCIPDIADLNYENLCIHLNLDLPGGFNIIKFDTFGGTKNHLVHLRVYCDQLVGVGKDEALLMRLFSRSGACAVRPWNGSRRMRLDNGPVGAH